MITFADSWLLLIANALLSGVCHWLLMRVLTRQRPKVYALPLMLCYHVLMDVLFNLQLVETFTVARIACNFLAFYLMLRYLFGLRGKRLWVCYLGMEICLVVLSLLSMALLQMTGLMTNDNHMTDAQNLAGMAAYLLATGAVAGAIVLGRRLPKWLSQHPTLWYVLRMALAVAVAVMAYCARAFLPELLNAQGAGGERSAGILLLFTGITVIVAVLVISLIYQDIRTLLQIRRNETLAQKQKTIDELLTSMRGFRHNIGNPLYGMEGAMAAGDLAETKDFYRQLVEKCILINSENVLALRNLGNLPLEALLHKLDAAYRQGVPMYLYAEPHVSLHRLSKSDMCEIVGVLVDNALEVAVESPAPYVSLELRALKGETELVVRNTFAGVISPGSFGAASVKAGHEGMGVRSVRELLARQPEAFLNYHVAGRYVEAQVLIG